MSTHAQDNRNNKVLVYHYRANNSPVVPNGLALISRGELDEILAKHPSLKTSTKSIPRGARAVDIHQRDISPSSGGSGMEESNVAGVKLPLKIWLQGIVKGGFGEIVVLSQR